MAAAIYDVGAIMTRRAAQATARDDARSAVLGRFDAADARRRFSLGQADAARADQAARTARNRAEPGSAARDRAKTEEIRASSKSEPREQTATASTPKDTPRASTTRSEASGSRSETKRGPSEKPTAKPDAKASSPAKAEPPQAADEVAPHENAPPSEAQRVSEATVPGTAVVPQPGIPPASAYASVTAQSNSPAVDASDVQQPEAREAVNTALNLGGKTAAPSGSATAADDPSQPAAPSQVASPDAGASFSAVLDNVEPNTSTGAGASALSLAKAATSAESAPGPSPTQAATAPMPLGAVPMTIALRSLQNASRFEIRLDPIELGRIDVRLDIDKDTGTISADLVVDRPATLALLQRDAATLQQALSQAGLDASGGIGLSLRDGSGGQDRGDGAPRNHSGALRGAQPPTVAETTDSSPVRAMRLAGLDIRI